MESTSDKMLDPMYNIHLDESDQSSLNTGEDSFEKGFEKDFEDILSETSCELNHLIGVKVKKIEDSGRDPTFEILTKYKMKTKGREHQKKVVRKYSEYEWLQYQLQKSFPGTLIPDLPTLKSITQHEAACSFKSTSDLPDPADITFFTNNEKTILSYTKSIVSNKRYTNFVKLKEFLTNSEKIKNIPNMNNDDPLVHSKIFKFIKSQSRSLLEYYLGSSTIPDGMKDIEMKGKNEELKSPNDLSVPEIEHLLKAVKDYITSNIKNIESLCEDLREVMVLIVKEKSCYKAIEEALEEISEKENDPELKTLYGKTGETFSLLRKNQNKLAADTNISKISDPKTNLLKFADFKALSKSYYLLNQYLKVDRAIDRLLDLAIDVEDLKNMLEKFKNDSDKLETYKSEYNHYLNLLRINFESLREDSTKMQEKEEENLKKIIHSYHVFQKVYLTNQEEVLK
ncbi:unnamed protein product [Moneuplotes crassus]|uniref:PX domain-containing protein n=1 Tax=Euplotes crassus TaxID=5936 RepID=A0AAD1UI67_EUPCR|nr:unnamed protein product [Moneuplotes crassus]